MNWKKTFVILWPLLALLLSIFSTLLLDKPISASARMLVSMQWLPGYAEYFVDYLQYLIPFWIIFVLSSAAWLVWRGRGGFFMTLFSALLVIGPVGSFITFAMTYRR